MKISAVMRRRLARGQAAAYLGCALLAAGMFMMAPRAGTGEPVEIVSSGHDVDPPENATAIDIQEFNYSPDTVTVAENATVVWTNREPFDHDVTFQTSNVLAKELKSPRVGKGGKIMVRFNEPGEYRYYCHLHPFMEGTVRVEPE